MPINDPELIAIARKALLDVKICRKCYARNPLSAQKCRKCKSKRLRVKRHERAG